jgi:hypothetical protein
VLRETKLFVVVLEDKRRAKIVINKDYQPAVDNYNRMPEYESSYPWEERRYRNDRKQLNIFMNPVSKQGLRRHPLKIEVATCQH